MRVVVIRPWQARLIMGLAFALFLAGGYRLGDRASVLPASTASMEAPLFEIPGAEGLVGLTVNVDWGAEEIPAMLDIFDQFGAKVTFFPTGNWAEANAELARRLVERGHEVGNHGHSHVHPRQLRAEAFTDHVAGNHERLMGIVGRVSKLYAPPYGEWDRRIVREAARLGFRTVLWSVDTIDWQDPSPELILTRVLPKVRSGSIVLMHPKPNTVAALPRLLEGLQQKGLRAATLADMLASVSDR